MSGCRLLAGGRGDDIGRVVTTKTRGLPGRHDFDKMLRPPRNRIADLRQHIGIIDEPCNDRREKDIGIIRVQAQPIVRDPSGHGIVFAANITEAIGAEHWVCGPRRRHAGFPTKTNGSRSLMNARSSASREPVGASGVASHFTSE